MTNTLTQYTAAVILLVTWNIVIYRGLALAFGG